MTSVIQRLFTLLSVSTLSLILLSVSNLFILLSVSNLFMLLSISNLSMLLSVPNLFSFPFCRRRVTEDLQRARGVGNSGVADLVVDSSVGNSD